MRFLNLDKEHKGNEAVDTTWKSRFYKAFYVCKKKKNSPFENNTIFAEVFKERGKVASITLENII